MEKSEILSNIFSKTNAGIKLGLERMQDASKELGNPHLQYKVIHVAGTNGKGSVCTFTEAALRSQGFKTGLYTSPHLIDFKERFRINGVCCSDDEWLKVYNDIKDTCDKYDLTFFEISTLIAFVLFKNAAIDYAIIETGLGGRLDATNIVDPEVSIITKIGIDHVAYLGDNIVSIAQEKLGIVKDGKPVIMQIPEEKGIKALAENIAKEQGCKLLFIDYPEKKYALTMQGDIQQINANTVVNALQLLGFKFSISIKDALLNASLPGRYDKRLINGKKFIFDVSHNPQAVEVLIRNLKKDYASNEILVVAGLMRDKDTSYIIKKYCEAACDFIFTKPQTDRSELPENLASMVINGNINVDVKNEVREAVDFALQKDKVICVTGSFFTVGEAMEALGISL